MLKLHIFNTVLIYEGYYRDNLKLTLSLPANETPVRMVAGFQHILILCKSGLLLGYGYNVGWQLGENYDEKQKNFQRITITGYEHEIPKQIATGDYSSSILCEGNRLLTLGGHRDINRALPRCIEFPKEIEIKEIPAENNEQPYLRCDLL